MFGFYPRTVRVIFFVALAAAFASSDLRLETWAALLPFFEWMETTWLGTIGKTWGASFAVVEAFHLLGMALLGGAVLVGDGRLLGICFTDIPQRWLQDQVYKVFRVGLVILLASGVFQACSVAVKIYYLPVYWYKMLALVTGILFSWYVRRPLLAGNIDQMSPWVLRLVGLSSIMIWFTVAASGRWIGFSG